MSGVLSGISLCDGLISRPEESYRLWCVVVCDLETPRMRRTWPALGRSATRKKKNLSSICDVDLLRSLSVFFPYFHKKNNKQPYYTQTAVHSATTNNLRPDRTVKELQIPLSLRFQRLHHVRASCLASIACVPIR